MTVARSPTFRRQLGIGCAAAALLPMLAAPVSLPARAQTAKDVAPAEAPPAAPPADGAPDATPLREVQEVPDPPARVGRIARLQGNVSFRLPEQDEWIPAEPNFPVTAGNAIWTEPGARAAVQIGRSNLALDGGTDLQFAVIDETTVLATMPQGTVYARLRDLAPGETVQLVTPKAQVTLERAGRYLVEAGPGPEAPEAPVRMAVYEGSAVVAVAGLEPTRLAAGQAVLIPPGGAPPRIIRASAVGSPLIAWAAQLEPRVVPPRSAALMTGVDDLGRYGRWARHPEYGDVWYPPPEPGWAPYSAGRWVWRDPWGWTWVDERPWGYVTSHYGRWVQIGEAWAWAPAPVVVVAEPAYVVAPRPVWAPALVAFVGGVAIGAAAAGWARPVAWIPLGPREPYYPWYRCSPAYVRNVNLRYVTNITQVTNTWNQVIVNRRAVGQAPGPGAPPGGIPGLDPRRLANRRAAIAVPAETLIGARPVRPAAQRLDPGTLGGVPAPIGAPPVPPARQTPGVTPRTAQRLGAPLPDAPGVGGPPRAPGPPPARHAALLGRGTPPDGPPRGGPDRGPAGIGPDSAGRAPGLAPPGPGAAAAGPPGPASPPPGPGGPGPGGIAGAAAAGAAAGAVGGALLRPGGGRPGQPGAFGGPPLPGGRGPDSRRPADLARPDGPAGGPAGPVRPDDPRGRAAEPGTGPGRAAGGSGVAAPFRPGQPQGLREPPAPGGVPPAGFDRRGAGPLPGAFKPAAPEAGGPAARPGGAAGFGDVPGSGAWPVPADPGGRARLGGATPGVAPGGGGPASAAPPAVLPPGGAAGAAGRPPSADGRAFAPRAAPGPPLWGPEPRAAMPRREGADGGAFTAAPGPPMPAPRTVPGTATGGIGRPFPGGGGGFAPPPSVPASRPPPGRDAAPWPPPGGGAARPMPPPAPSGGGREGFAPRPQPPPPPHLAAPPPRSPPPAPPRLAAPPPSAPAAAPPRQAPPHQQRDPRQQR